MFYTLSYTQQEKNTNIFTLPMHIPQNCNKYQSQNAKQNNTILSSSHIGNNHLQTLKSLLHYPHGFSERIPEQPLEPRVS